MKEQGGPGPHDGHSIDGGQRGVMRIAVSPKNQALCYISRVGQICTAVALHVHLAAKGFLQQWMYLAVAERPEDKHQCDSSKPETEGADHHQLKDEPSTFPRMSSNVHSRGSVRLAANRMLARATLARRKRHHRLQSRKQCRGLPPNGPGELMQDPMWGLPAAANSMNRSMQRESSHWLYSPQLCRGGLKRATEENRSDQLISFSFARDIPAGKAPSWKAPHRASVES